MYHYLVRWSWQDGSYYKESYFNFRDPNDIREAEKILTNTAYKIYGVYKVEDIGRDGLRFALMDELASWDAATDEDFANITE